MRKGVDLRGGEREQILNPKLIPGGPNRVEKERMGSSGPVDGSKKTVDGRDAARGPKTQN